MAKKTERSKQPGFVLRWFLGPDPDATSPEIARSRRPVVETPPVEAPPASPPVPVDSGPRGRQLLIRGTRLYEIAEDGSIWLAADDGHEEDILTKWKKAREKEINFT